MKWLCVALALAIEAAAARAQTPAPSSAATTVWNELQAARWGVPYADWQRARPRAACEPFVAPADASIDYGTGGVEFWSYRCRQAAQSTNATWFFYAFDPREPVVARLEQFRVSVEGLPLDELTAAHRDLSNRLSARYGVGERPGRYDIDEWASSYWRDALRWQNAELQIYLYIEQLPFAKPVVPRLKFQVRRRTVLDTMATVHRLEVDQADLKWADSETTLDAQLALQMTAEFPKAAVLLSSPKRGEQEQAALMEALVELLDAARTGARERRALLLMAADRLAGRVGDEKLNSPAFEERRQRLASYALNFDWAELGSSWMYAHDLLWRIWQEFGDTPSGGRAFLHLLSRGWDTRIGCRGGSDQFRQVIPNGERFLRDRPRSPYRPQVLLFLAQSYETWWSLSRANERESYANPQEYQEGASMAREKAIGYYNELLRLPAAADEAAYARLALPRLKLGIDTGQRRFFCIYD